MVHVEIKDGRPINLNKAHVCNCVTKCKECKCKKEKNKN